MEAAEQNGTKLEQSVKADKVWKVEDEIKRKGMANNKKK